MLAYYLEIVLYSLCHQSDQVKNKGLCLGSFVPMHPSLQNTYKSSLKTKTPCPGLHTPIPTFVGMTLWYHLTLMYVLDEGTSSTNHDYYNKRSIYYNIKNSKGK